MSKTNTKLITLAIFITTFMSAIEGTIVSTAMPTIVADLNGLEMMNWVVSIFLLATAISTPIYGKLADSIGRKPVFLSGIALFLLGSILCGFAHQMGELIFYRVIQGLGSGAIQPVAVTILADLYTADKRSKIIGINSGFWGVASVIAPLLGGFIVQHLSWHWVFFINVPLGIFAFALAVFYLHEEQRQNSFSLDLAGTVVLVIFLLSLMIGLQLISDAQYVFALVLMTISVFSLCAFIKVEKRAKDAIIPFSALKTREFVVDNLLTMLISGVVIGFEFYIPTWMQGINGTSASYAGFAVTPSSLMWIVGSFLVGSLVGKFGLKRFLVFCLLDLLLADLWLVLLPINTPFIVFCLIAAINGTGFGALMTATQVRSQVIVKREYVGVATSFNTLMKYLGQTILVSIYGIVFNQIVLSGVSQSKGVSMQMMNKVVSAQQAKSLPDAVLPVLQNILLKGLKGVFLTSLIVILLSIIIGLYNKPAKQLN